MSDFRIDEDHPTVAEVRRWRAQVVKEAGDTLKGLIELMRTTPPAKRAKPSSAKRPSAKPARESIRRKKSA